MIPGRSVRTILFSMMCALMLMSAHSVMAQDEARNDPAKTQDERNAEVNLETQLYLLMGSNQDVGDSRLPAVLEPVVRQLRTSFPFKNYRLAATLINRVKDNGSLKLRWVGEPFMAATAQTSLPPSFNDFRVNSVKLVTNSSGQPVVRMEGFAFGARIPIQTNAAVAVNPPVPVINYENTGLNTDMSMREGEPVIVGTLNVGPSGDAIILVMSARRTNR